MSARRFHLPALGGLLGTLGGLVVAVAQSPALLATVPGKLATGVIAVAAVLQSVTKPIQKEPPSGR